VEPESFDRFPHEQVLWTGSPVRRPAPDALDLLMLGMGLFVVVFSVFWVSGTVRAAAPLPFTGFGVLIGVAALAQIGDQELCDAWIVIDDKELGIFSF